MDPALKIILYIVALIVSVGFLVLVLTLVPAINQFRLFISDLHKTSAEIRSLTLKLTNLGEKVDRDIENIHAILDTSKDVAQHVSKSVNFIHKNIFKRSAGFVALIPAIRFGWKLVKKAKGGKKNV